MKNPIVYVIGAAVVLGAFLLFNTISQQKTDSLTTPNEAGETAEHIAEEKAKANNQQTDGTENKELSRYGAYTLSGFEAAKDKKRVYFFHAKWCETCFAANAEFTKEHDKIPADVLLFKTDYDTEKELKIQYGITYQHTFVYVDKDGKQIKKWNGGAIDELIINTK